MYIKSKAISSLLLLSFFLGNLNKNWCFFKLLIISKPKQFFFKIKFWELILLHRFHRLQTIDCICILFKYTNFLGVAFALWNLFSIFIGFQKSWHVSFRNLLLGILFISIFMHITKALVECMFTLRGDL